MRKRVEFQYLSKRRQNAEHIFKTCGFFVGGDIRYIVNSFGTEIGKTATP
jgi:hypothetical protein